MKKFTLLVFTLLCFGIVKAHEVKKAHPFFTQKTFSVSGINKLKDYNVAFKFFPEKIFRCGPAPKVITFQNKLMMENSSVAITQTTLRNLKYSQKLITQ